MASDTGMNLYGVVRAKFKTDEEFITSEGRSCKLDLFAVYKGDSLDVGEYQFQTNGVDLKINFGLNDGMYFTFTCKGAKKYRLTSLEDLPQSLTAAMKYIGFGDMLEEGSPFFTDLQDQFGSLSREEKKVPSPARVPPKNLPTILPDLSMYIQDDDEKLTKEELEKAIQDKQLEVDETNFAAKEQEELAAEEMRKQELRTKLALLRKAQKEAEDRIARAKGSKNSFAAKASASSEAYPSLSSALVGKAPLDKRLAPRVGKKGGAGSNAFAALPTEDNDVDSDAEE